MVEKTEEQEEARPRASKMGCLGAASVALEGERSRPSRAAVDGSASESRGAVACQAAYGRGCLSQREVVGWASMLSELGPMSLVSSLVLKVSKVLKVVLIGLDVGQALELGQLVSVWPRPAGRRPRQGWTMLRSRARARAAA
jgi:hypothetical protein